MANDMAVKKAHTAKRKPQKRTALGAIARYKSEAKEIAAAKQAMQRLNRGIELEPERLHYVNDLRLISTSI
jgi:hypothetical protein